MINTSDPLLSLPIPAPPSLNTVASLTETLPMLSYRSMESGNHLNGFVGSRTSSQSGAQPLDALKTKKFCFVGEVDKEDGDDVIELVYGRIRFSKSCDMLLVRMEQQWQFVACQSDD